MNPITIDAFTQYNFLSALQYSPTGAYAAFVVSRAAEDKTGYDSELWLYTAATGAVRPLTAAGKEKAFSWIDGDALLFPAQRTEKERKAAKAGPSTTFYRLPVDGGEARAAFTVPLRGASAQRVAGGYLLRATYDPKDDLPKPAEGEAQPDVQVIDELPFWFNGQGFINKKRARLYSLPDGGEVTALTPPLGAVGAMAIDPDGKRVAYAMTTFDSVNPQRAGLYLYDIASGQTTQLLAQGAWRIGQIAFLGEALILTMTDESRYGTSENGRIYRLPLAGGQPEMLAAPDVDLSGNVGSDCRLGGGITYKADGSALYLTLGIDNGAWLYRMDAQGKLSPISDGLGSVDCFDVHDGKILYIGMRDLGLAELYALEDGNARQLSAFGAGKLDDCYVATPQPLSFVNSDGVRIDGWVLLPQGYDPAGSYPAIYNIHGGPKAVFGDVFFHEMQFWASRGYVVFFCNPRGSGGRGDAFADLRGKYGTIDYADLMDFADQVLAAYPAIDASRVCVAGGSYGGFMVNWIIGHTDRFAAACSQRSIANWTSKCLTTDIGYYHNLSQIAGDPWQTPELFWEKSPLKHAPNAKTPTLFIHSNEDYRCWMAEGLQMFTALKMHGVETRLCLFAGENHELSRSGKPVNRIRRLQEITDWFDAHTARA